jgi:hydroxyacylglutathione hydrolase
MRLSENVWLAASGAAGLGYTHPNDCNAYAVRCGESYVLIDCGVGVGTGRLLENLRQDGIAPEALSLVLLTHAHLDHSGGACFLHDTLRVPVACSEIAAAALQAGDAAAISLDCAKRLGLYAHEFEFRACPVSRRLSDGEVLDCGGVPVTALSTPGHSRDMMTYLFDIAGQKLAFCGDTVFLGGRILISTTYDCSPHEYEASLRRLADLPIDGLFPGHYAWCLSGGREQIRKTLPFLDRLLLPPNIL